VASKTAKQVWDVKVVGWDMVPPEDLLANPANFRRHPAKQREALRGSLNELGIIAPVIQNVTTGHLLDGHARVEEYLTAGVPEVPRILVEVPAEKEALALLETIAPPDLIISDVVMPVMDGYEFCRAVKESERFRNVPLILLTMLTDSKDVVYAMVSGADNFITKPYQGEYLVRRVKKILARNTGTVAAGGDPPADVVLSGRHFTLPHDRQQLIDFLLSAYEAAVLQHQEVLDAQKRLSQANEEANLYLDIITHDIYNVNTGAMALTELLLMKSPDANRQIAQRLAGSIHQSSEIIGNVSTIRKLHEKKEALRSVDLDEVIKNEVLRLPGNAVRYEGIPARVMADSLLPQVFTNLIGNSIKFAGAKAEVAIGVTDHPGYVEVTVSDNGPGIPDEFKPAIFDRFRKGKNARSGKGLGLFIARTLVEGYGGTIRAEARVPGDPCQGALIRFTLKKEDPKQG
jgi:signal transduction histidine kinase